MAMALCTVAFAAKSFPKRDITNVVVWSAGGGTDTCNRIISAEMQQFLGVNINVANKPGGVGGSVGMAHVYSRPHDGYTLCGLSESCVTAGVQGGWNERMNVWDYFIVGGSPDIISVTPNSPYKNLKDLMEAAKAAPGSIKAGASAAGSIHHLNLLALEKGSGAKFNYIPYPGSAPSQTAAMTGEISVVVTSLAEQQQLLRGGKLRPLAMLIPDSFDVEGIGTIPSSFTDYPGLSKYLPISQAIGFAIPADTPADAKAAVEDAFKKAMATDKMKKWGAENYYLLSGKTGAAAKDEFNKLESLFAWTLWDMGAAKVDPATLNIPKP
jgi:tripartite-type tricarboxylate transporter receptor subunit TctC